MEVPAPLPPADGESFFERLLARRKRRDAVADANKRRISLLQPESFVAEQFRALRGRIDAIAEQRSIRTVAVTSALPGEGKTTAAVNLAIVTALSLGRRILLIDCDLRKPKVHQSWGRRPPRGVGGGGGGEAIGKSMGRRDPDGVGEGSGEDSRGRGRWGDIMGRFTCGVICSQPANKGRGMQNRQPTLGGLVHRCGNGCRKCASV